MDWRTIVDEKEKYAAYLCSPEWGQKRREVADRSRGVCERCLKRRAESVHHLTYSRKYDELPADLQHVCESCHDFIHGRSNVDPMEATEERSEHITLAQLYRNIRTERKRHGLNPDGTDPRATQ